MILFLKRSLYASWTQNLLHDPPDACPTPDAPRVAAVNDHTLLALPDVAGLSYCWLTG